MTSSSPKVREMRARALELHLAGATYQAIADTVGFASKGHAHDAVQAAIDDLAPDQDITKATDVARYDAMLQGIWAKARRGDVQAIDRAMKLMAERRAVQAAEGSDQPEVSSGGSKLAQLRAIHGGKGHAAAG